MRSFLERLRPIWAPHPGQREFLEQSAKTRVLACGRRWGKTDACAADVVQALHADAIGRHLLIAPTLDQARLLYRRIVELLHSFLEHRGIRPKSMRERASPFPTLEYEGHRVVARSGHVGRSLRGNEATTSSSTRPRSCPRL